MGQEKETKIPDSVIEEQVINPMPEDEKEVGETIPQPKPGKNPWNKQPEPQPEPPTDSTDSADSLEQAIETMKIEEVPPAEDNVSGME